MEEKEYERPHLESMIGTAMNSLREMMDVNIIIGDIIEGDNGISVIPVSKVSCGFLAGGGQVSQRRSELPFVGGSGAGLQVQPMGFLVLNGDQIRLIPVGDITNADRMLEAIPLLAEQITGFCQKRKQSDEQ